MQILLIQARNAGDPMLQHELECFAARCALDVHAFRPLNLATERWDDDAALDEVKAVMVGGSGEYSLAAGGFDWHEHYLDLMRRIVARRVPMFASCFGFQALVQAFGGEVRSDPDAAEVGTFEISVTEAGRSEAIFADAGTSFDAQLGHNDSADARLPANLVNLARSERAPVQAIRVKDAPVIATQFHPELSMEDNIVRYRRYLVAYAPGLSDDEAMQRAQSIHRPSPVANRLLRQFLAAYVA